MAATGSRPISSIPPVSLWRMFVATGNGDFTGSVPFGINADYADSVLNLNLAARTDRDG